PGLQPDPRPQRLGECGAAPHLPGHPLLQAGGSGGGGPGAGGPGRPGQAQAHRDVRRPAAAGGHRPGHRHPSPHHHGRRAHRSPGLQDGPACAGDPPHPEPGGLHYHSHHPRQRHRRHRPPGGPHLRRPHRGRRPPRGGGSMKLGQAFKIAAKSIFSNIGRSALTMLGIIIGLAAVIILVSYAQGQNAAMRAYYESMGTNTVEVYAYTWDSSLDVSKSLYNYCLGLDNLVVGFTPSGQVYTDAKISYGSKTLPTDDCQTATSLYLGNDQYGLCNDYQIARGRELSFLDMEKLNQVCVLGSATAEELFSFADPLDKTITINGIPFRVVGVYESKSKGVKVG